MIDLNKSLNCSCGYDHTIQTKMRLRPMSNYPKAPSIDGLRLVESGVKINIDSFDDSVHTNRARVTGNDPLHVKQLQNRLANGWDESQQLPIAVLGPNNTPVLIDGHHRTAAWKGLGHTTIPVNYYKLTGICTLEDIIISIGLKANDHLPQKSNTKKDIESALIDQINREKINPEKAEIYMMLGKLNLENFTKDQYHSMANNIYKKTTSARQIVLLDKSQVDKGVRDNTDEFGRVDNYLPCTSTDNFDYANRAVRECVEYVLKNGNVPRSIVYTLGVEDEQDVWDARTRGIEKMKEIFDMFRDAVKVLGDDEYPFDIIGAYPQIRGTEYNNKTIKPVKVK